MANVKNSAPYPGTLHLTLDTTDSAIVLGDAKDNMVGSWVLQVEGNTWSGNFVPQARLAGASGASLSWVAVAYQALNTGNDVAGGTVIDADGLYAIRCDHGMELSLDYTHGGTSVDILARRGPG